MNEKELIHLIDQLRALSTENEWVEFKQNRYEPEELGEYISALANSACFLDKEHAYLVFGIDDKTHHIVGTSVKLKTVKVGNEELENWLHRMITPNVDFKIIETEVNGLPITIVIIDPAVTQPIRFKGQAFIRVGSYKRKLSDFPEKERKIWSRISRVEFETELAMKNVDDDEVLKQLDYPSYFRLMNINLPSNKQGILGKLQEEKLIQKTRNSHYHITNLGAILFAHNINQFEHLSRKSMRVIFYKDKSRLETIKEQKGVKGYAVGFEGMVEYIIERLPMHEEMGPVFRREVRMYPGEAIRELVANALIHQDFSITGSGPMVEVFSDRIEISNPGNPLVETLRFIDHHPQSRNEKMASLMRRMNICEERGSGIDKVIHAIETFQLPAPNFIADESFFKVILFARKSLQQMDRKDKTRACYQHCCLKYVSGSHLTNHSLRERFAIKPGNASAISKIIADSCSEGLVKVYDTGNKSKRLARYVPFWA